MMFIMRHIEIVRTRPEHIRKQIALGAAVVVTAVIALMWLVLSVATGAFAIDTTTSFGEVAVQPSSEKPQGGLGSFVGAAAAALGGTEEPAHIEIVNTSVNSTLDAPAEEPTILPF